MHIGPGDGKRPPLGKATGPQDDPTAKSINRNRSAVQTRSAADGVEKHRAQMELECGLVNTSNILFLIDQVKRGYDPRLALDAIEEFARDSEINALEVLYGPPPKVVDE